MSPQSKFALLIVVLINGGSAYRREGVAVDGSGKMFDDLTNSQNKKIQELTDSHNRLQDQVDMLKEELRKINLKVADLVSGFNAEADVDEAREEAAEVLDAEDQDKDDEGAEEEDEEEETTGMSLCAKECMKKPWPMDKKGCNAYDVTGAVKKKGTKFTLKHDAKKYRIFTYTYSGRPRAKDDISQWTASFEEAGGSAEAGEEILSKGTTVTSRGRAKFIGKPTSHTNGRWQGQCCSNTFDQNSIRMLPITGGKGDFFVRTEDLVEQNRCEWQLSGIQCVPKKAKCAER